MLYADKNKVANAFNRHVDNVLAYLQAQQCFNIFDDWCNSVSSGAWTVRDIVGATPDMFDAIERAEAQQPLPQDLRTFFEKSVQLFGNKIKCLSVGKKTYSVFDLFDNLGVSVCPYCHINHVLIAQRNGRYAAQWIQQNNRSMALSLSFYNILPCCDVCSTMVNDKKLYFHPYRRQPNDDIRFVAQLKGSDFLVNANHLTIHVASPNAHLQADADVLQLANRYQVYTSKIVEMLSVQKQYNPEYLQQLQNRYQGIFTNHVSQLHQLTYSVVPSPSLQQPLSKFMHDMYTQFFVE